MNNNKSGSTGTKGTISAFFSRAADAGRLLSGKGISDEDERLESKKLRKKLLLAALCFSIAFIVDRSPLPFGATGVGIAFFCASGAGAAICAFFGLVFSSLFSAHRLISLLTVLLALVLRLLVKRAAEGRSFFDELPSVRMALAACCSFVFSFAFAALDSFAMNSVYAIAISVISAPLLTVIFTKAFLPPAFSSSSASGAVRDSARCVLLFFVVYSLDLSGFSGFSLGVFAGFFITLYAAASNGSLRGAVIGLVCGLACGVGYAPVFAAAGLVCGLLNSTANTYSVLAALSVASAMDLYINGYADILFFMGEILLCSIIFLPLYNSGLLPKIKVFSEEGDELSGGRYAKDKRKNLRKQRLSSLSSAFDELSDVFLELSERQRKPGLAELKEAGDEVYSRYCGKCPLSAVCWQKDYKQTSLAFDIVIKKLQAGEELKEDDLPEFLTERCKNSDRILHDLEEEAARIIENAVKKDKTELFALDYEAMAEMLEAAAAENDDELEADKALSKSAAGVLRALGISALGYSAWGRRGKTIVASGVEIGTLGVSGRDIKDALEKKTHLKLSEPRFDFSGDFVTMCVESLPVISTDIYCAGRTKEDEEVSGDMLSVFESGNYCRYALICDGMGSGRTAAITSRIATVFLEKMLCAGNKTPIVIKLLSNFLRSKSDECHCTADLLEIDLLAGRAVFTKCGASASYVIRGESVFRIDSKTLPIGITREISSEQTTLSLCPGDVIIMVSDGAAAILEDEQTVRKLVDGAEAKSPEEIAEGIIGVSSDSDDRSAIVIKIKESD